MFTNGGTPVAAWVNGAGAQKLATVDNVDLFVGPDWSSHGFPVSQIFEKYKIDDLPVVDASGQLVGYVDIQDLPKMKVM